MPGPGPGDPKSRAKKQAPAQQPHNMRGTSMSRSDSLNVIEKQYAKTADAADAVNSSKVKAVQSMGPRLNKTADSLAKKFDQVASRYAVDGAKADSARATNQLKKLRAAGDTANRLVGGELTSMEGRYGKLKKPKP